jgi:hypothetical protein
MIVRAVDEVRRFQNHARWRSQTGRDTGAIGCVRSAAISMVARSGQAAEQIASATGATPGDDDLAAQAEDAVIDVKTGTRKRLPRDPGLALAKRTAEESLNIAELAKWHGLSGDCLVPCLCLGSLTTGDHVPVTTTSVGSTAFSFFALTALYLALSLGHLQRRFARVAQERVLRVWRPGCW